MAATAYRRVKVVGICWVLGGARRATWVEEAEHLPHSHLWWDRFGFRLKRQDWVAVNALGSDPMRLAQVKSFDYFTLHLGPDAVVIVDLHPHQCTACQQYSLTELCTMRAVRHWVSVWRFKMSRRWKRDACVVMSLRCGPARDALHLVHSFL